MQVMIVEQTMDGLTYQGVQVPECATIEMALKIAGRQIPEGYGLSVYGMRSSLQTTLQEGDRIELSRPLCIDPKEARRLRAMNSGQKHRGTRRHAK